MRNYPGIGVQIADNLLPLAGTDLTKWAVIACDQFTSEPEYWQEVEKLVGRAPSALNLILPEVYLGKPQEKERAQKTWQTMNQYLSDDLFQLYEGLILVERNTGKKTRHGLMMALDLENYDFNKGSQTLIRATEGTILERIPPRVIIRKDAPLELPHILVLIDDPQQSVIEPLIALKDKLQLLYDFKLMLGSGNLKGYFINQLDIEQKVVQCLEKLASPEVFYPKYNVGKEKGVLLFAMGDGNHSLATAKTLWEQIKPHVGMNHPARYALVEIENVHDEGLEFEPIHRILFDVQADYQAAMQAYYGKNVQFNPCISEEDMVSKVLSADGPVQLIGIVSEKGCCTMQVSNPSSNLPVGSLQCFLDDWKSKQGFKEIDYVHGEKIVSELGSQPGNLGFFLPSMHKGDLFKTVILDGALPRKTFSMGEAKEKRFYMECKKIR